MRGKIVTAFIFLTMMTGAVSAAPVLDYTGVERQGETKQKKPEKRITAYWRRNTKKKQRNGAKAEATESPCTESWEP